jgi:hypothetical protein
MQRFITITYAFVLKNFVEKIVKVFPSHFVFTGFLSDVTLSSAIRASK